MKVGIGREKGEGSYEGPISELREVFNSVVFVTEEGNRVAVCMRDDTLEFNVEGFDLWHRIDMNSGRAFVMKEEAEFKEKWPSDGCSRCGYEEIKVWDYG